MHTQMRGISPQFPEAIAAENAVRRGSLALLHGRGRGLLLLSGLALALLWAYWPALVVMWERWSSDPQYSHGFLVPLFALVVLWSRRSQYPKHWGTGNSWGFVLLLSGWLMRFISAYFYLEPLDGLSLLPMLAGLVLLLGGWPVLHWCWPAIAFLGFMLPLPFQVEMALAQPLRQLATLASTYALQTLGYTAIADGNIILVQDVQLGVLDACSGLGMLFTFFALATAVALVLERPLLDRLILVASAIPIALIVNSARITATGMVHLQWGPEAAQAVMHDLAGWLMMPLALLLVWLELWFLKHVLVQEEAAAPLPVACLAGSGAVPPAARISSIPGSEVRKAWGCLGKDAAGRKQGE